MNVKFYNIAQCLASSMNAPGEPESTNKCTQNLELVEISNHGEIQTKENDPAG